MRDNVKKQRTIKAYGVFFTPAILDTMVAGDNGKFWRPYAIFKLETDAKGYRKEKFLGNPQNEHGVEVKEVTITYHV